MIFNTSNDLRFEKMTETLQSAPPQETRIRWIDTAKLIGIFLVILGHLPLAAGKSGFSPATFIYTFHMPLFFFLSGLVEKNRPVRQTLVRSAKSLLIPYAAYYLITYVWWLAASFLRHPERFERSITDGFFKPMAGLLLGVGFDTDYSYMTNVPLWFLVALFWCRLINALANRSPRILKPAIALLGFAVAIALSKTGRFLPFSLGAVFMALPFYFLGDFFGNSGSKIIPRKKSNLFWIAALILGFAGIIVATIFNGNVDVNGIGFGRSPVLFLLGALCGTLMTCAFSQLLPSLTTPRPLAFLAQNTIVILAFHSIISGIYLKIYARCFLSIDRLGEQTIPLPHGIAIALLCLITCALPAALIRAVLRRTHRSNHKKSHK